MVREELQAALRGLRRRPRLLGSVALAIGLGIAAATTVLAIAGGVLRPVPWPHAERIVSLWQRHPRRGIQRDIVSSADFLDWQAQARSFERLAGWRFTLINLTGRDEPERVQVLEVTPGYLELVGSQPMLGRSFAADENRPGRDRVILLGHALWQRRFGADPAIVGRTIPVDGTAYTVVGVLGPDFWNLRVLDRPIDALVPMPIEAGNRADRSFFVYGLMRPGISAERAQAEMNLLQQRLAAAAPEADGGWQTDVRALQDDRVSGARPTLELLLCSAGLLLLLVCTNVANLLLARSLPRRREIAIRIALGASRWRIVVMLLAESSLLALAGGALGILLSLGSIDLFEHHLADTVLPRVDSFRLTLPVALLGLALSLASGLLCGLLPALRLARIGSPATGRTRAASVLMALELGLAIALLGGGAVTLRAAWNLRAMDRGFDPHGVTVAQLALPARKYPRPEDMRAFYDRVLERVRALPGVESASLVGFPPLALQSSVVRLHFPDLPPDEQPRVEAVVVDRDYFRTLRIGLRAGRTFTDGDDDERRGVAVVGESFARRLFPGENPIGREVRPEFPDLRRFWIPVSRNQPLRIIGVVADVRHDGLANRDLPSLYLPYRQNPLSLAHLLVRGPQSLATLQTAVSAVDPDQPLFDVRTLDDVIDAALARQRILAALLTVLAALAALVAGIGVYSVTAHGIARRVPEIGLRIALGASPRHILGLIFYDAGQFILAGELLGIGGTWALCRLLAARLVGVPAHDTTALVLVAFGLGGLAVLAAWIPARRALAVDPMVALRVE